MSIQGLVSSGVLVVEGHRDAVLTGVAARIAFGEEGTRRVDWSRVQTCGKVFIACTDKQEAPINDVVLLLVVAWCGFCSSYDGFKVCVCVCSPPSVNTISRCAKNIFSHFTRTVDIVCFFVSIRPNHPKSFVKCLSPQFSHTWRDQFFNIWSENLCLLELFKDFALKCSTTDWLIRRKNLDIPILFFKCMKSYD